MQGRQFGSRSGGGAWLTVSVEYVGIFWLQLVCTFLKVVGTKFKL